MHGRYQPTPPATVAHCNCHLSMHCIFQGKFYCLSLLEESFPLVILFLVSMTDFKSTFVSHSNQDLIMSLIWKVTLKDQKKKGAGRFETGN